MVPLSQRANAPFRSISVPARGPVDPFHTLLRRIRALRRSILRGMTAPQPRQSLLRKLTFDADGHLRGWRLLGVAAVIALVLTIGGFTATVVAGTGSPEALAYWAILAFVAIKLPVLGVIWWLLGRSEHDYEDSSLTDSAARAALDRLREARVTADRHPDAWDRLDGLAAEAAYIAHHASPDLAGDARILQLDLIAARDKAAPPSVS